MKTLVHFSRSIMDLIRLIITLFAALLCLPAASWAQRIAFARTEGTTRSTVGKVVEHAGRSTMETPGSQAMSQAMSKALAARDLPRGTILGADDIRWIVDPASGIQSDTGKRPVRPGWITRRFIRAGEPLMAPNVGEADAVRSGDPVDVVYYNDQVTVRLTGIAVGHGAPGDPLYVKLDSRRRLRATVVDSHTVRVGAQ